MPNYMEYVCKSFINGNVDSIEPIKNGNINKTFRVTIDSKKYILQSINTKVFKDPISLMNNIYSVTEYIKKTNPACTSLYPIKADNGELFVSCNGEYYRMYNYIESISYDTIEPNNIDILYNIGHAYGEFGKLLNGFNGDLVDTIPDFHNTPKRYGKFLQAISTCKGRYLEETENEIAYLIKQSYMYDKITSMLGKEIPIRVTHNDTKINNVLLDMYTKEDICVIDLDTVMNGSALYDFGDAIRSSTSTIIEDSREYSKVDIDLLKYELFTKGYLSEMGDILTDKEKELLPLAPRILTLELALRFLTDYLEGSWYFKTNYPKHNLVRARNQIILASKMEEKEPELREIVNKIYSKNSRLIH